MNMETEDIVDLRIKHPSTILLAGMSQGGKSWLVKKIIEERDKVFSKKIDLVIYVYKIWQPIYSTLENDKKVVFSTDSSIIDSYAGKNLFVIMDDLMLDIISKPKQMQNLFTVNAHHKGISVAFLTQALYFNNSRILSLNTNYVCLFKFNRDQEMIKRYFRQINSSIANQLFSIYLECTKKPYHYMLISFHPAESDLVRYRNSIFVNSDLVIYQP